MNEALTEREQELLICLAEGLSNREIAARLHLAYRTVRWYNSQLYSKLGVGNREAAVAAGEALGLFKVTSGISSVEASPNNLPAQTTTFVGRQSELLQIARLLDQQDTRMVTIHAPGGMGKTQLAMAVAERQLRHFADGVYFISLAPLRSPDDIVTAIAEHIGFSFHGEVPAQQQLTDYLRQLNMLLVLDNFEHLLDGAPLVTEILRAAPQVKVLATSREKLSLSGETVFSLSGLVFPNWETPDEALDYDAVKLFMQSAQRVRPDFALQAADLDYLARICRLTGGMPLGIVLAAGWLDVMSLEWIATEIQQGIDILETDQRDLPERQRSVRATFNYSWARLAEAEQNVFMKLSVFRGGFTAEAAQAVAGADVRILRRLVSKALVHLRPDGRYDIHELLRQYGVVQLGQLPQVMAHTQELYCTYYATYMLRQSKPLISRRQRAVIHEMGVEINNILEAWRLAIANSRADALNNMAFPLWYYCMFRIPHSEARRLFGAAAEAMEAMADDRKTEIVYAHMLVRQNGNFYDHRNQVQGRVLVEKALSILRTHEDCPQETVYALHGLGVVAGWGMRDFATWQWAAEEGVQIARKHDDQWGLGHCLFLLGLCLHYQGYKEQAWEIGAECLRVGLAMGDVWLMASCSANVLGQIAISMADYAEAEQQIEAGIRWYQEVEDIWGIAVSYELLCRVGLKSRDYDKATTWLQQSLGLHQQTGRREREYHLAVYSLSQLFAAQGQTEAALETASALQREHLTPNVHELVAASLTELRARLPEAIYDAAVGRGQTLDVDAIITAFLAT